MDGLPDGVDEGHFVSEKFHKVEDAGDGKDEGVGEDLQLFGKMNDSETLEKPERRYRGVDIKARGETGAEDETESFEGAHVCK